MQGEKGWFFFLKKKRNALPKKNFLLTFFQEKKALCFIEGVVLLFCFEKQRLKKGSSKHFRKGQKPIEERSNKKGAAQTKKWKVKQRFLFFF